MSRWTTIRALTPEDQEWVVREVGAKIRRVAEEIGASEDEIWRVAEALRCIVARCNHDDPEGRYVAPVMEDDLGTIYVNRRLSLRRQIRIIRHELAHHLMVIWVPRVLYGVDVVLVEDSDTGQIRHAMARRVEEMVGTRR